MKQTFWTNLVLAALAALFLFLPAQGAGAAQKKAPAKAKTTAKSSKTTSKKSKARPVATYRARQTQPTPERYREIQQALADHGYYSGEVDGNWGSDSVDALKRFQRDQNLADDGKITALSLIGLGLGPERNALPNPDTTQ